MKSNSWQFYVGFLLVLGLFVGELIAPAFFVLASGGPPSTTEINPQTQHISAPACCRLKHRIRVHENRYYGKGAVIGDPRYAGVPEACPISPSGYAMDPHWAGLCTLDGVMTFAEWILWIGLIATVTTWALAGFMFVTSSGNAKQIEKAKQILYYSLIGVALAIGSRLIPGIARYFLGV